MTTPTCDRHGLGACGVVLALLVVLGSWLAFIGTIWAVWWGLSLISRFLLA